MVSLETVRLYHWREGKRYRARMREAFYTSPQYKNLDTLAKFHESCVVALDPFCEGTAEEDHQTDVNARH